MPTGTKVYHTILRVNLIVCQVNANNQIICINPGIMIDDNQFKTLTVNKTNLEKGWKEDNIL